MARSLLSLLPPSWLLKLLLSCAPGGCAGAVAGSLNPAAPLGLGVDPPDGTSSALISSFFGTPLVMRSSSPCGCVTVTFVGGLVSAGSASASAEAGRLCELVRVSWEAFGACCCCTMMAPWVSSWSESSGVVLELRRVWCCCGGCCVAAFSRSSPPAAGGGDLLLLCLVVRRSVAGRMRLAIALSIAMDHL